MNFESIVKQLKSKEIKHKKIGYNSIQKYFNQKELDAIFDKRQLSAFLEIFLKDLQELNLKKTPKLIELNLQNILELTLNDPNNHSKYHQKILNSIQVMSESLNKQNTIQDKERNNKIITLTIALLFQITNKQGWKKFFKCVQHWLESDSVWLKIILLSFFYQNLFQCLSKYPITEMVPYYSKLIQNKSDTVKQLAITTLREMYSLFGPPFEELVHELVESTLSEKISQLFQSELLVSIENRIKLKVEFHRRSTKNPFQQKKPNQINRSQSVNRGFNSNKIFQQTKLKQTRPLQTKKPLLSQNWKKESDKIEPIIPKNEKHLEEELKKNIYNLKNNKGESWEPRIKAMIKLQSLLNGGATKYPVFYKYIHEYLYPFMEQLKDLRSQINKQICFLLAHLSREMGNKFESLFILLFEDLLALTDKKIQVMSESGDICIRSIILQSRSPKIIPKLFQILSDTKSSNLQAKLTEYLLLMLQLWGAPDYEKYLETVEKFLLKSLDGADQKQREAARYAFSCYSNHFPQSATALFSKLNLSTQKLLIKEHHFNITIPTINSNPNSRSQSNRTSISNRKATGSKSKKRSSIRNRASPRIRSSSQSRFKNRSNITPIRNSVHQIKQTSKNNYFTPNNKISSKAKRYSINQPQKIFLTPQSQEFLTKKQYFNQSKNMTPVASLSNTKVSLCNKEEKIVGRRVRTRRRINLNNPIESPLTRKAYSRPSSVSITKPIICEDRANQKLQNIINRTQIHNNNEIKKSTYQAQNNNNPRSKNNYNNSHFKENLLNLKKKKINSVRLNYQNNPYLIINSLILSINKTKDILTKQKLVYNFKRKIILDIKILKFEEIFKSIIQFIFNQIKLNSPKIINYSLDLLKILILNEQDQFIIHKEKTIKLLIQNLQLNTEITSKSLEILKIIQSLYNDLIILLLKCNHKLKEKNKLFCLQLILTNLKKEKIAFFNNEQNILLILKKLIPNFDEKFDLVISMTRNIINYCHEKNCNLLFQEINNLPKSLKLLALDDFKINSTQIFKQYNDFLKRVKINKEKKGKDKTRKRKNRQKKINNLSGDEGKMNRKRKRRRKKKKKRNNKKKRSNSLTFEKDQTLKIESINLFKLNNQNKLKKKRKKKSKEINNKSFLENLQQSFSKFDQKNNSKKIQLHKQKKQKNKTKNQNNKKSAEIDNKHKKNNKCNQKSKKSNTPSKPTNTNNKTNNKTNLTPKIRKNKHSKIKKSLTPNPIQNKNQNTNSRKRKLDRKSNNSKLKKENKLLNKRNKSNHNNLKNRNTNNKNSRNANKNKKSIDQKGKEKKLNPPQQKKNVSNDEKIISSVLKNNMEYLSKLVVEKLQPIITNQLNIQNNQNIDNTAINSNIQTQINQLLNANNINQISNKDSKLNTIDNVDNNNENNQNDKNNNKKNNKNNKGKEKGKEKKKEEKKKNKKKGKEKEKEKKKEKENKKKNMKNMKNLKKNKSTNNKDKVKNNKKTKINKKEKQQPINKKIIKTKTNNSSNKVDENGNKTQEQKKIDKMINTLLTNISQRKKIDKSLKIFNKLSKEKIPEVWNEHFKQIIIVLIYSLQTISVKESKSKLLIFLQHLIKNQEQYFQNSTPLILNQLIESSKKLQINQFDLPKEIFQIILTAINKKTAIDEVIKNYLLTENKNIFIISNSILVELCKLFKKEDDDFEKKMNQIIKILELQTRNIDLQIRERANFTVIQLWNIYGKNFDTKFLLPNKFRHHQINLLKKKIKIN
ncbi:clip-associated protein [Anaeramoeba flamelloides]|uniref:Clip-associated protein n=1 Tax=Anaeramoeba flamelloides TaxID=1746091 RepID=A0ABQ8YRB8_9EUKA|nr:clip-associated protein [Anaeramoeba flamelloides]